MLSWLVNKATGPSFYLESTTEPANSLSNLTVNCYNDASKSRIVPCKYTWYRFNNGVYHTINNIWGNTYICDGSDIGSIIKVQVSSVDAEFQGTKILEFGPVRMNTEIRKKLQTALSEGMIMITAKTIEQGIERECEITIATKTIKVKDIRTQNCYKFQYQSDNPKLQMNSKDPTKASFKFSSSYCSDLQKFKQSIFGTNRFGNLLELQLNRENRQFLYVLHKCFSNRSVYIIHQLQSLHLQSPTDQLQINSLKKYISDLEYSNSKLSKEVDVLKSQVNGVRNQRFDSKSSLVTLVTENNIQDKLNQLEGQKWKLMSRVKVLQSDNLRLSQQGSLSNLSRISKEQVRNTTRLHRQCEEIKVQLDYYKRKCSQLEKEDSLTSILDNVSDANTFKSSYVKLQARSLSKTPLRFGQKSSKFSIVNNQSCLERNNSLPKIQTCNPNFALRQSTNPETETMNKTIHQLRNQLNTFESQKYSFLTENKHLKIKIQQLESNIKKINLSHQQLQGKLIEAQLKKCVLQESSTHQNKIRDQYQKKIRELQSQILIFQNNQDILNKSRSLQLDYSRYKIQQKDILKQQNSMLMEQNERLARICEKYINEAKESTKLRGEIIKLKQEVMYLKQLKPQSE